MSDSIAIHALREKRSKLASEAKVLCDKPNITPGEDQRLSRLLEGIDACDRQIKAHKDAVRSTVTDRAPGFDSPTYWKQTTRSEVFSAESRDSAERQDLARRAADILETDTGREIRSDVIAHFDKGDYADFFRATASADYATGFAKILRFGSDAHLRMSDAERDAVQRVALTEKRDMSLTDANGGWAVPGAVDPAIMVNNTGSTNIRRLARVVTAVSDTWRGIASTGINASFVAEGAEVGDNSPTLVSPLITAHKAAAFIPYTYEISEDWPSMVDQMRELLADSRERLEGEKFLTGTGSGEPFGLITRLAANSGSSLNTTTAGTIGSVDIYEMVNKLQPRYRPNATWLMSMTVLNRVRALSESDKLGTYSADLRTGYGSAYQILGREVVECPDMDAFVNTTAAANFIAFGDISKFIIFDRLGSTRVQVIPALMGTTNNRPVGMGGLYAHWRVGSDVMTGSTTGQVGSVLLKNKTS